jgi:hypothetical protein
MLDAPNENGPIDGTEERPLILAGDNVAAWEILFSLQYDTSVHITTFKSCCFLIRHLQSSFQAEMSHWRTVITDSPHLTQILHGRTDEGDY